MLVVAAADLAHMGPAFGDPQPLDRQEKEVLKGFDREMLAAMCHGDAESFLGLLRQSKDKQKVCGLPPIYAALQLLGPSFGQCLGLRPVSRRWCGGLGGLSCGVGLDRLGSVGTLF